MNVIAAMEGPFEPWFPGGSWDAWKTILRATFALPLSPQELITFGELAGGRQPPAQRVKELVVIAGRRSGKDSVASLIAAFAAGIEESHIGLLRPGEFATVVCLAVDRDQAAIIKNYVASYFAAIPELRAKVVRETRVGLELASGVEIVIVTNDYRAVRGRAVLCAVLDEAAFYSSENSASPDIEMDRAIEPGLATLPLSLKVIISSPHKKSGLLFNRFRSFFGKDDDRVLVIKAPTRALNPTIDQAIIDRALQDDPAAARAEWLGEFRDDVSGFLTFELIDAAVDAGVVVRPPQKGVAYVGFADVSSGSGQDSFVTGIAHAEGDVAVLDALLEIRPPFNPTDATVQAAALLKSYGLTTCRGDKYAAGWTVTAFEKHGVVYRYSDLDRSQIYHETLPLFTSGRARLLDNPRLSTQLAGLERRTMPGGRDRVSHGPSNLAHDDVCNGACGALSLVASQSEPGIIGYYRRLAGVDGAAADEMLIRLIAPTTCSSIMLPSGKTIAVGDDRIIEVLKSDAVPLQQLGWRPVDMEGVYA